MEIHEKTRRQKSVPGRRSTDQARPTGSTRTWMGEWWMSTAATIVTTRMRTRTMKRMKTTRKTDEAKQGVERRPWRPWAPLTAHSVAGHDVQLTKAIAPTSPVTQAEETTKNKQSGGGRVAFASADS